MFRSYPRSNPERSGRPASIDDEPTDADLVAAARADPRCFTALYERYLGPVYRYCLVRLESRETAEDVTSEIFLKVLAALPEYHAGVFTAWLFRIAHNAVVDVHRRRRPTEPIEAAGEPPDRSPPPEDTTLVQDERRRLRLALAQLPDDQRAVIQLQLAGWTHRSIAEALGKTPAAVKMLRVRAVARLRILLDDRAGIDPNGGHR